MRLILVRHGETDGNKSGTFVGKTDLPLNKTGEGQAALVAKRLSHETVAAIYVSDLQRAKLTAQKIAAFHPHAPLVVDVRLRERTYGVYEARPYEDLKTDARNAGVHPYLFTPEGGESVADAAGRAMPLIDALFQEYRGKTVVIVSHGALIRGIVMALLKAAPEEEARFIHSNTAVTIIELSEDGEHKAHLISDASHLP